jgi:HEAT repeat protein
LPLSPRAGIEILSQDTTKARPSAVLKSETGSLDQRWQWAEAQAKSNRYDRYWIGYMLDRNKTSDHEWLYFDRHTPIRIGESIMMGGMRTDGDPREMRVAGVPLNEIIGEQEPQRIVVFINYEGGQLARVHLASFVFPMHFGQAPLLWLGRADDAESVARIVRLEAGTRNDKLRQDLTAVVGVHGDMGAALPVLEKWALDGSRSGDLRSEAVEELQNFSSPRVLGLLSGIARNDAHTEVRAEAVEALGHLGKLGVLDTLENFARTMTEQHLQDEAIEAIANLPEKESIPALRALIEDRSLPSELRAEAVEALAHRTQAPAALEMLAQYARSSDDERVQLEAVEAMGEVDAVHEHAIRELREIVATHARQEVRTEAVETLGNFKESGKELTEIALSSQPMDVRMEAVDTYMSHADPAEALSFAKRVLDSNAPAQIQHEVIDALESLDGGRGIPLLIEIARTTNDRELRRQALEALIDSDDPRAVAALKKVQ